MCFKMKRSAVAVWVLFYGVQLMLPQGAMAVIRRRFFVGSVVGEERYAGSTQWPVLENHASAKYCVEPCTTMVLEASAQCHSCLLAHPMIPQYMQMIYWQLISDVLIALAYFSIPVELLYFIYKAQVGGNIILTTTFSSKSSYLCMQKCLRECTCIVAEYFLLIPKLKRNSGSIFKDVEQ